MAGNSRTRNQVAHIDHVPLNNGTIDHQFSEQVSQSSTPCSRAACSFIVVTCDRFLAKLRGIGAGDDLGLGQRLGDAGRRSHNAMRKQNVLERLVAEMAGDR